MFSIYHYLENFPRFKSYLGKRTDDIGYAGLVNDTSNDLKLTKYEKDQIKNVWGSIIPSPLSIGYSFYKMTKAVDKFNPYYLPSAYYMPYVFESLNLTSGLKVFGHKALQPILFKDAKQPENIVSRISGVFFDSEYNQITYNRAIELVHHHSDDIIFKPATDSSMGRGVKLVKSTDQNIPELLVSLNDFVVQKKVSQSHIMSELNASSLNCMRITTLNINNNITATNRIVKIGAVGAIVDNIGAGSGGMMLGICADGTLTKWGYRVNGTRVELKERLGDNYFVIPNFNEVLDSVISWHRHINSMA